MATLAQQELTPAQQHWLHFATNPEDCQTTLMHMTTVLKLALRHQPDFDEELEAINWVFYILETATTVNKEYIYKLMSLMRQEKEEGA